MEYGHRGYYTTRYAKLSGGEVSLKLLKEEWSGGGVRYNKYVKNGTKKIKKSAFTSQLKKYKGSVKAKTIKMYENTAQQRKKRLK